MAWDHLSITSPHLVYIILGGFTSLFMLCSTVIKERMYIGEATVATLCGVIFGPHAANLINPETWGSVDIVTIEFSRLVLVVQCFAVGVELPKYYMEKHWKSVAFLLLPVMTFGWLITGLFVWWLIEPLNFLESLVVAACVTATDPVLASSVVGKGKFAKRVPKHLRDLLSAESGCNDGMAFPFIYLSLYLIHDKQSARDVSFHWIVYTILYECIFGAVYGFIIGYIARHGIKYAEEHDLIDRESFLVFYFVLALFCAGSGSILGIDDLLVGFAAGVGFSNDGWFTQKTEESHVSNVIDLLINLAYFVYFGTIIPWKSFNDAAMGLQAWRLAVLAIFIILFRRIPAMMALKPFIPDIKTWREALFAGHFGPIGVGAIFIAILARAELESGQPVPLSELPPPNVEHFTLLSLVWPIVAFIVVSSIIVHGSSIAVFTLGKRINTLTITMSYTQANEDGPSWMNRLPRISSQSRSQARTMSDTEGDELKLPEFPPGTLPPVGFPGNFLRRVKEEDTSKNGSRSSSLAARRRKKKWDDGIGPGGPISQSAIFPQRRSQGEALSPGSTDQPQSPTDGVSPAVQKEKDYDQSSLPATSEKVAGEEAAASPEEQRGPVEVYDEGDNIVVENRDGDVVMVEKMHGEENTGDRAKSLATELKAETGTSGWTYDSLKKRILNWRETELKKRKAKGKTVTKGEPARAFQFGNTIIVENEDGDVIKKYELPTQKPQTDLVSQGLKYMGMGVFAKAMEKSGREVPVAGESSTAAAEPTAAQKQRKKSVVAEQEEDDDRHIRFTIGGIGRRMTKEDFIEQMQKLDKSTRREVVDKSDASRGLKAIAKLDPPPPPQVTVSPAQSSSVSKKDYAPAGATEPTAHSPAEEDVRKQSDSRSSSREKQASPSESSGSTAAAETEIERKRRLAALEGTDHGDGNRDDDDETDARRGRSTSNAGRNEADHDVDEDEEGETAAERRRREAALGMAPHAEDGEDSDDDDTPRVPPSRRSIRFADAVERGSRE
ncbi:alkali metal cation/H+ antiporter Nha1 C terminus-domain-containing protein [Corynascus novoguineensis]|uniref:Alkali metal cation/H+ antiporter Nha1 C terminus-domain-containing protein n=1 Tax=Corynascus novoguineensis TaxID=1126955 RepID=A0AAN7HVB0_9PEZI|nr:alkali metal cation/H+ antiporter Nha1 C terminus-domain-containing protein [Corynascus novoguineensis]